MAKLVGFALAISLLVNGAVCNSHCERDMSKLEQVIQVFRHGDRNPESTFPTDVWQEDKWPLGWGELIPRGIRRHYEYGQWMRQCYGNFFGESVTTKNVYVRSTDIDRTLMSAQAHLAGVYPPKGNQTWGQPKITLGTMWQPFPVHTVSVYEDGLLRANQNCVRYTEGVEDAYNSTTVKDIETQDAGILNYLATKAGLNSSALLVVTRAMSDPVIVEMQQNKTLVDWLANNKTLTDRLVSYFDLWFQLTYAPQPLARLAAGPLLQAIVDNMVNRTLAGTKNAPPSFKHIIYSGHDTTVASLLGLLGDFDNIAPPYTASVIVELHKIDEKNHGVLIFYRNSSDADPYPVNVGNCTGFMDNGCNLTDFISAVSTKVTRTHSTDCLSGRTRPAAPLDMQTILIVVGVTAGLMVMTIAIACLLKYLRRRPVDELLIEPGVN